MIKRFLLLGVFLVSGLAVAAADTPSYKPLPEKCDGFSKLPLGTSKGLCVGLLAQRSAQVPLKMPRTAVETPDGKLLVVDMGGWAPNKGKLWLVDFRSEPQFARLLLDKLNLPHKLLAGRDGKYYLGEAHQLIRFKIPASGFAQPEVIIDKLPYNPEYLHPLKNFVFDGDNNLILNIGSSSDRCTKNVSLVDCASGVEAALRLYKFQSAKNNWSQNFQLLATGLRNSMALAVTNSGTRLQAENSIDLSESDKPYEEINIIEAGGFYGWPFCYDRKTLVDTNTGNCSAKNYREPWVLLPPHVAPLDMLVYQHKKLPDLDGKLLMTWHGYKRPGHRLVAFNLDEKGRPLRTNSTSYSLDPTKAGGNFTSDRFTKETEGAVPLYQEIITRWNPLDGIRPKGAPVGLSVMNDGSLLIVDDKNAALLRLSTGTAYEDNPQVQLVASTKPAPQIPRNVQELLVRRCSQCHEALKDDVAQLLNEDQWLRKVGKITRIEQKLFEDKTMPMPPDRPLSAEDVSSFKAWLGRH